jgi:hypothetical protein
MSIITTVKPSAPLATATALALLGQDQVAQAQALAQRLERVNDKVAAFVIKSDADAGVLTDLLADAKLACDELDRQRKAQKDPHQQKADAVQALFNPSLHAFKTLKDAVSKKIAQHLRAQQAAQAKALEEQEAKRKAAEAEFAKAVEAKDEKAVDKVSNELIAIASATEFLSQAAPTGIRSTYAMTSLRNLTKARVVDINLVPRQYLQEALMADEGKALCDLAKRYAKDKINIPGVEIYEDPVIATRVGLQ